MGTGGGLRASEHVDDRVGRRGGECNVNVYGGRIQERIQGTRD